jgi:hypothetical protein
VEAPTNEAGFAYRLKRALREERPLLDALTALRALGNEGEEAIGAISALRRINTIKFSWELWEAIVDGDGDDPETLLLDEIPLGVLDRARHALWGSWRNPADDAEGCRSHE